MNPSFTDAKLRQGCSKKISCSFNGSLTSTERWYQRFFDKRQSLKVVYTNLRVSAFNVMLDNTRTNRLTQILEDLKR